jgi:dolichyl-diphosphooligosaccharide--protein glycosyltransferase
VLPLHAFVLVLMGRFTNRLYISYSSWYLIGTLASMQVPFVGFLPLKTSEHMAALGTSIPFRHQSTLTSHSLTEMITDGSIGVFGLLQLVAFVQIVRSHLPAKQFQTLLTVFVVAVFTLAFAALVVLTMSGTIAPWTGRFYSLWDTGYAKIHSSFGAIRPYSSADLATLADFVLVLLHEVPIIASVSEHQPTAWPSFFFDLEMLIFIFPAGIFLCFQKLTDGHVFIIIYAALASYFAGVGPFPPLVLVSHPN